MHGRRDSGYALAIGNLNRFPGAPAPANDVTRFFRRPACSTAGLEALGLRGREPR